MSVINTGDCKIDKSTIDSIMRWVLFGVIIVVAPPLFNGWFKIIVGFAIDFSEYTPDVLLTVLSVCCNLINSCVDGGKRIAYSLRWLLGILLGIISVGCWGLFFAIRFSQENIIGDETSRVLFYVSTGIIVFCGLVGVMIEWYTQVKSE